MKRETFELKVVITATVTIDENRVVLSATVRVLSTRAPPSWRKRILELFQ